MAEKNERVNPIEITDPDTGEVLYTLEFNRNSVAFAERHDFLIFKIGDKALTGIQDLFYYSFRMHHPRMEKKETDEILEELGGIKNSELVQRLQELYFAGMSSLNNGEAKNARFGLKL